MVRSTAVPIRNTTRRGWRVQILRGSEASAQIIHLDKPRPEAYALGDGRITESGIFDNLFRLTKNLKRYVMAESTKVNYDAILGLEQGWVTYEDRNAKIGADPSKGIPEDVDVPFSAAVFNVTTREEAAEYFEAVGADVFNTLNNYAADLKLRGRAVNNERGKLTSDPLKKEVKAVALLIGDDKVDSYRELRAAGHSKAEALAQLT
ncbi:MAG: hypothetical protein ACYTBJ_25070 [Planctomycetota bacterium]